MNIVNINSLNIAICYEPPASGDGTDLQDILKQAEFLERSIRKHHAYSIAYNGDVSEFIDLLSDVDIAWNLFETFNGKEEQQQLGAAIFEIAQIPYTGSSLDTLTLASDKRTINALLRAANIAVPLSYDQKHSGKRWIVKPAKLHGSVGIDDRSVVSDVVSVAEGYIAEEYIDGREFSASLLDTGNGLKTIAVAEMQFIDYPAGRPKILGFDAKWAEESADYRQTQRSFAVDEDIAAQVAIIADKATQCLNLQGFARIDFRMSADGQLYVIDVNPNPGLGKDAGFIAACEHAGLSIEASLEYIIKAATL